MAATESGTASVDIVDNLTLIEAAQLDFGFVVPSAANGTYVLPANGNAGTASNLTALNGEQLGEWTVAGSGDHDLTITLPTGSIFLNDSAGTMANGAKPTVDAFEHNAGATPALTV